MQSAITDNRKSIFVLSESTEEEDAVKPWGLAKITFEYGKFVHESIQCFYSKEGAEKQFALAQGLEEGDNDSIDDYC